MTPAEFQKLPIMALPGTEGNDPTGYTELQLSLLPYIDLYHNFLWICFFGTLAFIMTKYLLRPAYQTISIKSAVQKTARLKPVSFKERYISFFSLEEIENDIAVRLFGGAVLLGFVMTFKNWEASSIISTHAVSGNYALCWPFFQSCYDWIFMASRPQGYMQNIIYMFILGISLLSAYGLLSKKYIIAHASMLLLFLWKLYATALSYNFSANYDYYHTAFAFVFLFASHKRFFGSLVVVMFYFLSTATKIHESWSLGTYFTAMQTGLPIFSNAVTPFFTNIVIFMEMIGCWFLFSKNKFIQRSVFFFFVMFHLYSGLLVGFHYPVIVTPALLIFFGPLFIPPQPTPINRKAFIGWAFILFIITAQMTSHVIRGDEKLTLEGNFFGLYMFEANHQCTIKIQKENDPGAHTLSSVLPRDRCDPYHYWFRAKKRFCTSQENSEKYSFKMTHSINGGPFYLIVDEPDLCALTYKPFAHNAWIKTKEEAEPVARPLKNLYR